jgi:Amt family ammonium transporter
MFAVITPAIISGAVVERMRFSAYVIFILFWTTFVYDVIAHWSWSAWTYTAADGSIVVKYGWLRELGALDFAGGTVVHISSGISALVAAIIVEQ